MAEVFIILFLIWSLSLGLVILFNFFTNPPNLFVDSHKKYVSRHIGELTKEEKAILDRIFEEELSPGKEPPPDLLGNPIWDRFVRIRTERIFKIAGVLLAMPFIALHSIYKIVKYLIQSTKNYIKTL